MAMARRPQAHRTHDGAPPREWSSRGVGYAKPPKGTKETAAKALAARMKTEGHSIALGRRWTLQEVAQQEDAIESLLRLGVNQVKICRQVKRPPPHGLGLPSYRTRKLVARILVRWEEANVGRREQQRLQQIEIVKQSVAETMGRRDPQTGAWIERPNHSARRAYLELLSKLTGTQAPMELNVNVEHRDALVGVFAQYTVEELEGLHRSAEAKHRLAAAYVQEHPDAVMDAELIPSHAAEE